MLANQYQILERLDPENSKDHETCRIALERGYELSYETCAKNIFETVLSAEECEEVVAILSMFRALRQSTEELTDKTGIDLRDVQFDGFDGNNDTKQLAYPEFFCTRQNRFSELNVRNSHMPVLGGYRSMRRVWESCVNKYQPTKEEVVAIAKARYPKTS
jgi:uncharacterized protein YfbU (UPF0304 family)